MSRWQSMEALILIVYGRQCLKHSFYYTYNCTLSPKTLPMLRVFSFPSSFSKRTVSLSPSSSFYPSWETLQTQSGPKKHLTLVKNITFHHFTIQTSLLLWDNVLICASDWSPFTVFSPKVSIYRNYCKIYNILHIMYFHSVASFHAPQNTQKQATIKQPIRNKTFIKTLHAKQTQTQTT